MNLDTRCPFKSLCPSKRKKRKHVFNVTAARNNFLYLKLSSALVFVKVSVVNHDSATEDDKLKKPRGKVKFGNEKMR